MIFVDANVCDLCGTCIAVCPADCIELTEFDLLIDNIKCINCNACVKICPFAALRNADAEVVPDETTL